jgi:hypothetical protein
MLQEQALSQGLLPLHSHGDRIPRKAVQRLSRCVCPLTCLVTRKLRIWVIAPVVVAAPTAAKPLCKLAVEAGLSVLCRGEGGKEPQATDST